MVQQPLQLPSDDEWAQDEAICIENITRKADAFGGIYKEALQRGSTTWHEDEYRYYLDLLELIAKRGSTYDPALEES